MIIGNNFAILKGHIMFDPKIQNGDNGSYTYVTVNQLKYKKQDGTKVYQKVQCQFNGPVVDKVVGPFIKKGTFVVLYGDYNIQYEKNAEGYDDVGKPKSVIFKVGEIGHFAGGGNNQQSNNAGSQNNNQNNNNQQSNNQGNQQSNNQNNWNNNQQQNNQQNWNNNQNQQSNNNPFGGSGPITVSDDDLPF